MTIKINTDEIKTGDFLILGFGKGTQGVRVVKTTAKRLEIIRCQQYLSDEPFWTGILSKISRTDPRIQGVWKIPASIKVPTREEVADWRIAPKFRRELERLMDERREELQGQPGMNPRIWYSGPTPFFEDKAEGEAYDAEMAEMRRAYDAAMSAVRENWKERTGRNVDGFRPDAFWCKMGRQGTARRGTGSRGF